MSLVDQSIATVRNAVRRFKKKPLAAKAGVSDSLLRNVHDENWSPTAASLRSFETAAAELEREHGPEAREGQRESAGRNPAKGRGR